MEQIEGLYPKVRNRKGLGEKGVKVRGEEGVDFITLPLNVFPALR